jgi:gluconate 2-dehydrogenase gamma chain
MERRDAIRLLGAVPLASAVPWSVPDVQRAAEAVAKLRARGQAFQPTFFTPHEYQTVRVLADLVIPKDQRSGSATDAGVPEFMDFMMTDRPQMQEPMRGGLAWLDTECRERFGKDFLDGADAERRAVLDDIAWPARAKPELSQGVAFFNRFRDLTASGFWSSKMGVADLPYIGNVAVPEWKGCPDEQLKKLGVSYGD